jgi:F-type H+-transporting ATPase subunit b
VYLLSIAGQLAGSAPAPTAEVGGFTINLFWVLIFAGNFIVFLALMWAFAFKPLSGMLASRQEKIEQGLRDAEASRLRLEHASAEAAIEIAHARREAREILERAQHAAQESREADIAATKAELERMRTSATADIEAEKDRAIADLRAEVAGLALEAAGRVVGESMSSERQRRLVEEFLLESAATEKRD